MSENVLSWSTMGAIRDSLNSFMDQELTNLSAESKVSVFEISYTLQALKDDQPKQTYFVGSGNDTDGIPLGSAVEDTDQQNDEFLQKLDGIIDDVYNRLNSELENLDLGTQGFQVSAFINTRLVLASDTLKPDPDPADGVLLEAQLVKAQPVITYSCELCSGVCKRIRYKKVNGKWKVFCTDTPCSGC